jgi:myo-inositol-1(or 4)-monophosphatase
VHPLINIATRAARAGGDIILRYVSRAGDVAASEKQSNDFVSEVDHRAEEQIIDVIRRAHPDHAILAEESGRQGNSEWEWIVDPLDGTTNFLHGFPHFAVAVAVRHRGVLEHAVVYDPLRNELFQASRGTGAQLENRRIRVSSRPYLDGAVLATGFPFKDRQHTEAYFASFRAVFDKVADIRRAGSAVLDLAYVACGRLDGFWELGLSPWDVAAGALLVNEAGGVTSDFSGGDTHIESGQVVSGSFKLHAALLETVKPHLKGV